MQVWTHDQQQAVEQELLRIAGSLLPHLAPAAIRAQLEKQGSVDIFNGSAGIILFYLRLYEHYRRPEWLEACQAAANALLQHPVLRQPVYYTLYTGATGLLYLCTRMYTATGDAAYTRQALALLSQWEEGILHGVTQDDLTSGHAGNIWVLACLHAHTGDERLPALIRRLTDIMIAHARIAPQGLRWGHVKRSYDCLAGFSHGASGIAYALMQAAQHFGDEGLQYLAEEALAYEMLYYDAAANNWLDLRLTSTRLEEADIMEWQASRFRKYASDANSWAHGAAGVGIARLYAWQVTGQDRYLQQAQAALQRCLQDAGKLQRGDFTLCSGYGGMAAFFLQGAALLQQPSLQAAVQQLAVAAVHYYQLHGSYNTYIPDSNADPGLFSGMAGVGWLLLDALAPAGEKAVTHPVIPAGHQYPAVPLYTPGEVKQQLFSRYYKNTFLLLRQYGADVAAFTTAADVHALTALLPPAIAALPPEEQDILQDCFAFEQCLTSMWTEHKGWLCYTRRKELLLSAAGPLLQAPVEFFLQAVFLPAPQVRLCHTRQSWQGEATISPDSNSHYYLLYSHETGISAYPAGTFTALIFNSLAAGKPLHQVITELLRAHFSHTAPADHARVRHAVIAQVRALLQQCLIKASSPVVDL